MMITCTNCVTYPLCGHVNDYNNTVFTIDRILSADYDRVILKLYLRGMQLILMVFNVPSLLLTYFCIIYICGTQKSPSPFRNTDVKA